MLMCKVSFNCTLYRLRNGYPWVPISKVEPTHRYPTQWVPIARYLKMGCKRGTLGTHCDVEPTQGT